MKIRLTVFFVSSCVVIGLICFQLIQYGDKRFHIYFCDVGQGDGILMRTPEGLDILVDAGPDEKIVDCLSRYMPLWDRTIELAFATHPDADHIGGYRYILKGYHIAQFNIPKKDSSTGVFKSIMQMIKHNQVPVRYLAYGDRYITPEGIVIETFWPTREYISHSAKEDSTNSFSLVQLVSYGNFKMLLTGDIEKERLNTIFSKGLSVDIFKLPHHGSRTGADDSTFKLVKSKLNILSVGFHNRYNHPSPIVLKLLETYSIPFLRTDEKGDIKIITSGNTFFIKK
jgi:competence protein ComEC